MAKTGFLDLLTQLGAGSDYIVEQGNDDILRFRMEGDTFPRLVLAVQAHDILAGPGTSPPVSIIGTGGGGPGSGLPVFNVVMAYSADNTGVAETDDPVNQAISDANASGGGIVYFPEGTYKVASGYVLRSNVILFAAPGVILNDARASGATIRTAGVLGTPIQRAKVQGLTFAGSGPTHTLRAIDLSYSEHCIVTENRFNAYAVGVWLYGADAASVSHNHFVGCSTNTTGNLGAVHVTADASGDTADCHVTENVFDGCLERCVVITGAAGHRPDSIEVAENKVIDGNVRGRRIDVRVQAAVRVHDNTFAISAFDSGYSTPVSAIYIADAQGASVRGNRFTLTGVGVVGSCIDIDATTASNVHVIVADNDFSIAASCKPTTACVTWRWTAPNYNRVGGDYGNGISIDGSANSVLVSGAPNTVNPTHQWGAINSKEFAVGDGVAYDGPALQAWVNACVAQGREGKWAAGTYLCQSDVSTPTVITIDKGTGAAGQSVFIGEGLDTTMVLYNVDLGFDTWGMPQVPWNPINCGKQQSVDLRDVSFQGNLAHSNGLQNANATPIPLSKGYGPRIANRCNYQRLSVKGFHTAYVIDGSEGGGQYVTTKIDGSNILTVDLTISPVPPSTIIGLPATGGGIPGGTTVTACDATTITLSNNVNNNDGNQSTDLTVGSPTTLGTDHFEATDLNGEECRYGVLVRRNSGNVGGGGTGTADFRFVRVGLGRCQWGGFVASEDGYYRDITFDSCHLANLAHSFYKEGTPGITPSQNQFLSDCTWVRTKSEGAGTWVVKDASLRGLCQNWMGSFEVHDGIEINQRSTHKFVLSSAYDHTWKPYTATATRDASQRLTAVVASIADTRRSTKVTGGAGTNVNTFAGAGVLTVGDTQRFDVSGTIVVQLGGGPVVIRYTGTTTGTFTGCTTLGGGAGALALNQVVNPTIVAVGDPLAVEALNTGSNPDKLYSDCAMVETITGPTTFTALLGTQAKQMDANYGSGVSTISIAGNPNVKNQDAGCLIVSDNATIPAGTFIGVVNFHAQTATLVDASDNPVTTTGVSSGASNNVTTSVPANAVAANIRFGRIGCFDLGIVKDWHFSFDLSSNFTSESVGAELTWFAYQAQTSRINLSSSDFPSMNLRAGSTEAAIDFQIDRAGKEAVLAPCSAAVAVGQALECQNNGQRRPAQIATVAPFGGIARAPANPGQTTVGLTAFASTGQPPFVIAARPFLFCQEKGPNFSAAILEGGGLACENPTASGKILVLSNTTAGRVEAWNGTSAGRRAVGYSFTLNRANFVDARVLPASFTAV